MTDTDDDVVADTVAAWKKAQGLNVTHWQAVGAPHPTHNEALMGGGSGS
jgi:hypothetical protein